MKVFAGTNDDVHVYIEGDVGFARTKLDNFLHDDFERGCTDSFDFTAEGYLGEIQKVELSKNGTDDWRCEYVKIIDRTNRKAYVFNFGDEKIKEATEGQKGAVVDIKDQTKNKKKSKSSSSSEGELEEFVNEVVDEVNIMIAEANENEAEEDVEEDIDDEEEENEEEDE